MKKEKWVVDNYWFEFEQELLLKQVNIIKYTKSNFRKWYTKTVFSGVSILMSLSCGLYTIDYMGKRAMGFENTIYTIIVLYIIFIWLKKSYYSFNENQNIMNVWKNRYYSVTVKKEPYDQDIVPIEKNGKYGAVSLIGEELIPFIFDEIDSFINGVARAKFNGKWGVIDKKGNEIIPLIYDEYPKTIQPIDIVKKDGKYGYINGNTRELITRCIYDHAEPYVYNAMRVQKNNKYGFLDKKGQVIIPIIYDDIDYRISKYITVKNKGLYGLIDNTGKTIVPILYNAIDGIIFIKKDNINIPVQWNKIANQNINSTYWGYIKVQKDNKWGLYDVFGKKIIPIKYDNINYKSDGIWLENGLKKIKFTL